MANAGQRSRIILLIVCLLFIVGGSAILLYNTLTQPGQLHAEATATSQQKLYAQLTSAQPTFYDPLNQQDSHRWEEDSKAGGGGCTFINGAYDASMPQIGFFASCYDLSSNFSNFVFQVQMTILKGDRGGIIFRSNNAKTNFYLF